MDGYTLSLQNVGSDTAHDVVLIVESDDNLFPRATSHLGVVPPGERIGMKLLSEANELQARRTREGVDFQGLARLTVRARVTWKSRLGLPDRQAFDDVTL